MIGADEIQSLTGEHAEPYLRSNWVAIGSCSATLEGSGVGAEVEARRHTRANVGQLVREEDFGHVVLVAREGDVLGEAADGCRE